MSSIIKEYNRYEKEKEKIARMKKLREKRRESELKSPEELITFRIIGKAENKLLISYYDKMTKVNPYAPKRPKYEVPPDSYMVPIKRAFVNVLLILRGWFETVDYDDPNDDAGLIVVREFLYKYDISISKPKRWKRRITPTTPMTLIDTYVTFYSALDLEDRTEGVILNPEGFKQRALRLSRAKREMPERKREPDEDYMELVEWTDPRDEDEKLVAKKKRYKEEQLRLEKELKLKDEEYERQRLHYDDSNDPKDVWEWDLHLQELQKKVDPRVEEENRRRIKNHERFLAKKMEEELKQFKMKLFKDSIAERKKYGLLMEKIGGDMKVKKNIKDKSENGVFLIGKYI